MKKAIIFGARGQDGFYLKALLERAGIEVISVSRSGDFLRADVGDRDEVFGMVKKLRPEYIFHLAANSTASHTALFENHQTIATGTLNILEAAYEFSRESRVFISGSALQFLNTGRPIKETDPFEANDPYSVSRIQSVYAARYFRKIGIKTYVGYFYNHDSPLRTERHIAKKISAAAVRIANGSEELLEIGDPSVIKEWGFAGDIVRAAWLLIQNEEIFEANLSNGEGHSVKEWADLCFRLRGLDPGKYIVPAEGYTSPYRSLVSDNSLVKSVLGYKPEVSFEQLAVMMTATK